MKKTYQAFDKAVEIIENIFCAIPMAVIIIVEILHVFYRYALRSGIPWSDEAIIYMLIICVMFGGARGIRHKGHTELTGLTDSMPGILRKISLVLTTLLTLAFLVILFVTSVDFTAHAGNLKTTYLRIPMRYCYMWLALGSGFMVYEFAKTIKYRITRDKIDIYDPENYREEEI